MTVREIVDYLDAFAPLSLQEDYDNAGLLAGDSALVCTGALCTLDVTEQVVSEAVQKGCNLIIAHHPLIFRGLKKITGGNQVEDTLLLALKNEIAIYASHTNLDNLIHGVNGRIADRVGLVSRKVLAPRRGTLKKLYTFVPPAHLDAVRQALFAAGAGNISDYSECSFVSPGRGTFRPGEQSDPFIGTRGNREEVEELKVEVILPAYLEDQVLRALFDSHPYEEVAYDIVNLANGHEGTGSGLVGELPAAMEATDFLALLAERFSLELVRHGPVTGKPVKRVAVCGGAGSFLIPMALSARADAFVTADLKYHEFPGGEGRMLLCDIGHFESEQFTVALLAEILEQKFPTFAVLKSEIKTNPVHYFTGK